MAASFEDEHSLNTASTFFMIHFGMLVRWTLGTSLDGVILDNQNIPLSYINEVMSGLQTVS